MASNENPLGPSPAVLEAVRAAVPRIYNYPDGNCYYLKRELAHFYHLDENNFIIGNGADEVIKIIGEAFLEAEDEVIYPWPTFSEYIFVTKLMGAKPIPVKLTTDFKYDFKNLMNRSAVIQNSFLSAILTTLQEPLQIKKIYRNLSIHCQLIS